MHADVKYLGIGLFIGLGATFLLLAGIFVPPTVAASLPTDTPTPTPTAFTPTPLPTQTTRPPTNTYTPTPTLIRLKTATSVNTPTITPTVPSPTPTLSGPMRDLYESGHLSDSGPLSLVQQLQVYESSIKYIRQTSDESQMLGEEINGVGYGSPSDICGPLSIATLQGAGLIDTELDPHAFWLLNPDVPGDRKLLAKTFPAEQFENIRVRVKLNKVDWHEIPLYPGDFIYIYAGTGGNFEHMLIVNRVDALGRAYAVTNRNTPDGFIISEVLLYHPSIANVGMFPVWTERHNAQLGSTGFAGFEIWRMRAPQQPPKT